MNSRERATTRVRPYNDDAQPLLDHLVVIVRAYPCGRPLALDKSKLGNYTNHKV